MKKKQSLLTRLACIAGLALTTATPSLANVLTNPGFEADAVLNAPPATTVTGWTDLDNAATASSNAAPVRNGIGSLLLTSPGGNYSVPEARQVFTAIPGQEWYFSGYMLTPTNLPANNNAFGVLKIVWRDANGADLQPAGAQLGNAIYGQFPGIESTPLLNSASTTNTWVFTQAKGVAPAGAASVVLLALLVDAVPWTDGIYFDDMVATNSSALPLTASITSPANYDQVLSNFTITASASVLPGNVTNVAFFDGATLLANDDTSPYAHSYVGASLGAHALKVVAQADTGASVTSLVVNVTVTNHITVTVNPAKTWNGYLIWFETPTNGGGYAGGGGWATADLRASFSGSTLTLSPNTIGDPNPYWYVATGNNSVGNKIMDGSMYVEPAGSLPGATVTFTGTCINNTLTTNGAFNGPVNPAGNGWTCVAFIKDFAPDFSSANVVTTTLTNGANFSISLDTVNDPARHVQYGFETIGPCVWASDTALAGYGNVQVGPPAPTIASSTDGSDISLSFATHSPFVYTVLYRTNLVEGTWSTLTTTNGTGASAVVTDSTGDDQRYYRLLVQ